MITTTTIMMTTMTTMITMIMTTTTIMMTTMTTMTTTIMMITMTPIITMTTTTMTTTTKMITTTTKTLIPARPLMIKSSSPRRPWPWLESCWPCWPSCWPWWPCTASCAAADLRTSRRETRRRKRRSTPFMHHSRMRKRHCLETLWAKMVFCDQWCCLALCWRVRSRSDLGLYVSSKIWHVLCCVRLRIHARTLSGKCIFVDFAQEFVHDGCRRARKVQNVDSNCCGLCWVFQAENGKFWTRGEFLLQNKVSHEISTSDTPPTTNCEFHTSTILHSCSIGVLLNGA